MKKVFSIILALTMLMSVGTAVFAAGATCDVAVVLNGDAPVAKGDVFKVDFVAKNISNNVFQGAKFKFTYSDNIVPVMDDGEAGDPEFPDELVVLPKRWSCIVGDLADGKGSVSVYSTSYSTGVAATDFTAFSLYFKVTAVGDVNINLVTTAEDPVYGTMVSYEGESLVTNTYTNYSTTINKARLKGAVSTNDGNTDYSNVAVKVISSTSDETTAEVKADGSYEVVVAPGTYSLAVTKPDYYDYSKSDIAVTEDGGNAGSAVLVAKSVVTGAVKVDDNDYSAVTVKVGEVDAVVNADGTFEAVTVPGTYDITVSRDGYYTETVEGKAIVRGANAVGTITLTPIAVVKGVITADDGLNADITVTVGELSATTDADGKFEISTVPGEYDIVISKDGYYPVTIEGKAIVKGDNVISETLVSKAIVTGKVTAADGDYSDVTVMIGDVEATVNADGTFSVETVPGVYDIVITKPGYFEKTIEDKTIVKGVNNIDDVELVKQIVISGTVDTLGVETDVVVYVADQSVNANEDGTYEVIVAPGTYTVAIKKPGYLRKVYADVDASEDVDLGEIVLMAGDVTDDDTININDLTKLLGNYEKAEFASECDFNDNGVVNINDLTALLANYEKSYE